MTSHSHSRSYGEELQRSIFVQIARAIGDLESAIGMTCRNTLDSFCVNPNQQRVTRLSQLGDMSHNSIHRFLQRENVAPKDFFVEVAARRVLEGGTLSVDDTVLDKAYSLPVNFRVYDPADGKTKCNMQYR